MEKVETRWDYSGSPSVGKWIASLFLGFVVISTLVAFTWNAGNAEYLPGLLGLCGLPYAFFFWMFVDQLRKPVHISLSEEGVYLRNRGFFRWNEIDSFKIGESSHPELIGNGIYLTLRLREEEFVPHWLSPGLDMSIPEIKDVFQAYYSKYASLKEDSPA